MPRRNRRVSRSARSPPSPTAPPSPPSPTPLQTAVYGNFSAPKVQEVLVAKGNVLELLRPDDTGRMQPVCSVPVFGQLRTVHKFRVPGEGMDHVIVGSDSGRLVILRFDKDRNMFRKVHQETYGKTGCRRVVPGQYLACDPRGRAIMVGAIEKSKLVYVINRDSDNQMTISSPLEAHKSGHLCFDIAGLDCGFDNPVFAAIEIDYSDVDEDPTGEAAAQAGKVLTHYELDLGLNHVVRKSAVPIDNGANMLLAVPGGTEGPGGCLVCCENFLIYRDGANAGELRVVIPRRESLPGERGVLLVAGTAHKMKGMFFFLVQSEYGDLYKVTLEHNGEVASELRIKYFDTVPPCQSVAVLKSGFLFAASEFGDHALYQFQGLGDDDAVEASSASTMETDEGFAPVFFSPRPLTNLAPIDEVESLSPVLDMHLGNLAGDGTAGNQLYALCGRGPRSSLRVLRPGLSVAEIAAQPLPGNPTAVWSIRKSATDEYDGYLVISFTNATLVLSIGETVEEVEDSGIERSVPTSDIQLLEDSSIVQIHPNAVRVIRPDRRANEWSAPKRRVIQRTACNSRQVVVAVSGGEIYYFELSLQTQALVNVEEAKTGMGADVACLALPPVPEGRQRSKFLAVGTYDNKVTLLSLEPETHGDGGMEKLAIVQADAVPASLLFLDEGPSAGPLQLHVGRGDGVLLRVGVDRSTGQAHSDKRHRVLGTREPKLVPARVNGAPAVLALSSRPWLGCVDMGRYSLSPLSFQALDHASAFSSEQCPEGFVAVSGGMLRFLTVERLGEAFNQTQVPLRYTPRRMVVPPGGKVLAICECDKQAVPLGAREDLPAGKGPEEGEETRAREGMHGAPRGEAAQWAGCVRLVDPATSSTVHVRELEGDEACVSMCLVTFAGAEELGPLLAVGCARRMTFQPLGTDGGVIHLFKFVDEGRGLELVHSTDLGPEIPGALCAFQGRLLAGCGGSLRLYEMGRKKMLRKCENRGFPTLIRDLQVVGDRIFVGDAQESVHLAKYRQPDNALYVVADDSLPRYVTTMCVLDYDSVAVADKFGNVNVLRLPRDVSKRVDGDPSGGKALEGTAWLNGAPNKLEAVTSFHVGDVVTSLVRGSLSPGGAEVLVYATVGGQIGCFLPLATRDEADLLQMLEMHLRQELPPLCGRDHQAYRSYHFVVKDCVDGDLVELFGLLPPDSQRQVADALEQHHIRSVADIVKKLEDVRAKVM